MIANITLIILLLILSNLIGYAQIPITIEDRDSIDRIFADWRKDSLGCLELRMKSSDFVISYLNEHHKSIDEIVVLLGAPNFSFGDIDESILNYQYFTRTYCVENFPDLNVDYCYLLISSRFDCDDNVLLFLECY